MEPACETVATDYTDPRHSTLRASLSAAVAEGARAFDEGKRIGASPSSVSVWSSHHSLQSVLLVEAEPEEPVKKHTAATEVAVTFGMVASGALGNFFASIMYQFSTMTSDDIPSVVTDMWLTFVLTLGVFVFCSLGAALSPVNRRSLAKRANRRFIGFLMIPSLLDVVITGMATFALALTQPALVGILKAAVQLVVLAVISRIALRKKQRWSQWLCMWAVLGGVGVLFADALLYPDKEPEPGLKGRSAADQLVGIGLTVGSGALGAVRNLVEAAILQEDDFEPGALLLAESVLSAALVLPVGLLLYGVTELDERLDAIEDFSLANLMATFQQRAAFAVFPCFLLVSYGKDAGKFWMIKHTSALRQKVLALLFPFGTWAVGLAVFYSGGQSHRPAIGAGWTSPSSAWQLAGFVVILLANVVFVMLKSKTSLPARLCAKIDSCCCS